VRSKYTAARWQPASSGEMVVDISSVVDRIGRAARSAGEAVDRTTA
jgi:hypothetical protein